MGLPSYIINHDELKQIIIESLVNTGIGVDLIANAGETLELDISIEKLLVKLNSLNSTVTQQEISISNIYMEVMNVSIALSELLSLGEIFASNISNSLVTLLAEKVKIKGLVQQISDVLNVNGIPKTITLTGSLGDTSNTLYLNYFAKTDMSLTALTIYQTSFNYNDYWELKVNDILIFKNIYSKSVIETKNFITNLSINTGEKIEISFYNNSKKSKTINYDIDFLIIT